MRKKYCITFAGVPGSSKSPIAHHLSGNLGLPVFNNDTIRTEVKEDLRRFDQVAYERIRDERADVLIDSGKPFIYDASIDRFWRTYSTKLKDAGYEIFIISLDLSRQLLNEIYEAKGYTEYAQLDGYEVDHATFLANYGSLVNLHIDDAAFSDRLELSLQAAREWIDQGYIGTIVEESLKDNRILNELDILRVRIASDDRPEDRWHLYTVCVDERRIETLSRDLKPEKWYMHFWNGDDIVAVYPNKLFRFRRSDVSTWTEAVEYGKSLGIPEEQLDFVVE